VVFLAAFQNCKTPFSSKTSPIILLVQQSEIYMSPLKIEKHKKSIHLSISNSIFINSLNQGRPICGPEIRIHISETPTIFEINEKTNGPNFMIFLNFLAQWPIRVERLCA
jgi:hypothetical protein